MATYDAHVADVLTTITKTLRIGGAALGTLTGATFVVKATNPSGVVESWTTGFTGGAAGLLTFVTPTSAYWDEVGTWTWDVQYTLGGVTATCDPITLSVGPSGAPPGTSGPPPSSVVNVRGYGAVADGTTDDGPAIQAALDAVAALTYGGIVYIPPGVYYIGNCLLVGSNTHVLGAGRGLTVLRGKAGGYAGKTVNGHGVTATLCACAVHHVLIEHLTVDHATNATQANGITFEVDGATLQGTPPTYCTVQHCEVLGTDQWEYLIWNLKGQHIRILNNWIDGNAQSFPGQTEGIENLGGTDVLIQGNTVLDCAASGIVAAGMTDVPGTTVTGVRIVDNYVSGCNTGIAAGTAWDSGSAAAQNLEQVRIAGNIIEDCVQYGLALASSVAGVTMSDVVFEGNLVAGAEIGIYALAQDTDITHRGVVFRGNTVRDCTSTTGSAQFYGLSEFDFEDNRIQNSVRNALYVSNCDKANIRDNTIDTCGRAGILIDSCNLPEIVGNRILDYNGEGSTSWEGITATACVGGSIHGNAFRSATSPSLHVHCGATCDAMRIYDNENLGGTWDTLAVNEGANPNWGTTSAMGVGTTTVDITNSLARVDTRFLVTQVSGTHRMFYVAPITAGADVTGFRITINAAAAGDEVFRWEILQ